MLHVLPNGYALEITAPNDSLHYRLMHRGRDIATAHEPSPLIARVVANCTPADIERFLTDLVADYVKDHIETIKAMS